MRIVIAPDKFKGSLTAAAAAAAIETGFRAVFPNLSATRLPLADGGEGTSELFRKALGGDLVSASVPGPRGRPVAAKYTWIPERSEAVIDMSAASGLWRLSDAEFDPFRSSTRGTGDLVRDAIARGARRIFLGLGGSATNDVGAGFAASFGFRFLNSSGANVDPIPANFEQIVRVLAPDSLPSAQIIALADATNPLLGSRGATRVYGPQKGATEIDFLESLVVNFAKLVVRDLRCDYRDTPGAGAAGGLGFGLLSFLGASIRSGFDACGELLQMDRHIAASDLILTGEGRLDATTAEGKGPGGIARLARAAGKPVIAFAGHLDDCDALQRIFDACIPITARPMSLADAMSDAENLLSLAAERTAKLLKLTSAL